MKQQEQQQQQQQQHRVFLTPYLFACGVFEVYVHRKAETNTQKYTAASSLESCSGV